MNFLGHCYLTRHNKELIPGNLAGDFFKGDLSKFKKTPKHIIKGVEIHRYIDSNTDNSPFIQEAAHLLQASGIKRISYIATDILLDHYLAKNWIKFSSKNLNKFIQKSYKLTENELINLPEEFTPLLKQMKKKDWLGKYKYEDGIDLILHMFGHKIPFQNNLHESFVAYKTNEKKIKPLFKAFLKEIDKSVTKEFKLK
jgi:acyl carrier protein phosphodiesterase